MSVLVKYSDVAIGAKEDLKFSGENFLIQSDTSIIESGVLPTKRYDIPFELNSMILDGGSEFLPNSGGRLPSIYKEVEYIESNGNQWIDTGVYLNGYSKVVIDLEYDSDYLEYVTQVFGYYKSVNEYNFCLQTGGSAYYGNKNVTFRSVSGRHTIVADQNKWSNADSSWVEFGQQEFETDATAYIFRINKRTYTLAHMKLYSCKIYESDSFGGEATIIRDFIPCERNDGVCGLYDAVNGVFYENMGTDAFSKGQYISQEIEFADIGFISNEMSDENGNFETPIVFEFASPNTYTSAGIALYFDSVKGIFPTHIKVEWYNGDSLVDKGDFYPDSPQYFCNKKVSFYNKVLISIFSLNLPKNRLRFNGIEYGLVVDFGADELRSAKIIQEIDPISTNIPINVFDFSIESKKNIDFSFQTKQPIEVYFNGNKKATSFVRTAKRKTKTMWQIQSEDYIGLMDSVPFVGGIYNKKNAAELINEIMSLAKVPYEIIGDISSLSVTGYIPYSSCRDSLMQVLFAIGMVADTSNSDKVKIFALDNNVSQTIAKDRILQGQSFEDETRVTAVELTAHAYSELSESIVAYEADKSGTGTNVFVLFTEPLHHLSITYGSIVESGVNYAIINANSGCKLSGKKYEHSKFAKRKNNPLVLSTDIEKVVSIESATLVSADNIDKILDLCYNYIVNTEKTSMKIVDRRNDFPTTVGDLISYETEYLGKRQGRIIKQTFSLVGGILSKDSVVR